MAAATDRPIWAILSQPNRVTSSSDKPAFSAFPVDWAFINAGERLTDRFGVPAGWAMMMM
jgi:hypothetical protein